ncbi:hypothetical protein GCM10010306_000530 [Streptomyces umbrinus]|nr:hypothetical protein GCM10010306_000530 [Streptomyces umbrinus]
MTVSGTPSALPLADPKLEVMSLRTTPLSFRTFTPLEPSPGYGPAVSLGMVSHSALPEEAADEDEPAEEDDELVEEDEAELSESSLLQPTSGTRPTPASSRIIFRR